ncbi:MAG: glycosyltransferase family 4 protein [Armatimonadota bacterium]
MLKSNTIRTPWATRPAPRILFLSSFVPRECGLATFTEDLMAAATLQGSSCKVIAMNRPGEHHNYDHRVVAQIQEDRLTDYLAVVDIINSGRFDILSIQHEFGIYGGTGCDHILRLLDKVNIPVITTLHTVSQCPSHEMRQQLYSIAKRSTAIMVMNGLATDILEKIYWVDPAKVMMIHHGAPSITVSNPETLRARLGCVDRRIISTFGLIGSSKGLEYAIKAMPAIVENHPDAYYYILGKTHPVVKEQQGERYRDGLKALATRLGVADHVVFVDKYLSKDELLQYLKVSDIYLTPYLNMEQVTSGTLAYALACGRPIISTPYLHAEFLLKDGRGLLVPVSQALPIAEACEKLLSDPSRSTEMKRANREYGKDLLWPSVGQAFVDLCAVNMSEPRLKSTIKQSMAQKPMSVSA